MPFRDYDVRPAPAEAMRPRLTLATQLLALQAMLLVGTVVAGSLVSLVLTRSQLDEQYEQRALAVAEVVAADPAVRAAVEQPSGWTTVQPIAEAMRLSSGASFIVVTDRNGIRLSHPNPALIGKTVSAPGEPAVALSGKPYTAIEQGSLGPSARGKAPIFDASGAVAGMVSVGYPMQEVNSGIEDSLPFALGYLAVALVLGIGVSYLFARYLKRQTFGLEPHEIARLLEHREAMLHGIREGAIGVDRAGRVTLVNDEARRLLELDGDVVGASLADVVPEGRVRDVLTGVIEGPDQIILAEGRILVANRMPVMVRGEDAGSVTTFRDRTELSGLHRELQGVRGMTDALRAQVHEFSNRLHTIAGLIELDRRDEAIRMATEAASVHQELAERLVDRIGDPRLSALLLAKAAVASEQAIDLRVSDDSLLAGAAPHPRDVATVVGNLIDNAFDAIRTNPPERERWVDVELREADGGVFIRVADSGPGVDPAIRDHVFEEGFTTKEGTGRARGLGLALIRQIIERHGGTVEVSNEVGAVFTVRLPGHDAAGAAARRPASERGRRAAEPTGAAGGAGSGRRP